MKLFKKAIAIITAAASMFLAVACDGGNGAKSSENADKMVITATSPSDGKTVCLAGKTVRELYVDYTVGKSDGLSIAY